ncbi:hypothetical protein AMS68_003761 [Peltaster fructicola]|uniref:Acyltransferase 3 domain-containing protein n=1 Tax=Peltaster fructicola TaxID=286661 RepID=A0A6H0XU35_9PEZI|nr:hypothetical protein AMS68_003761 [Peltaster fructicola]
MGLPIWREPGTKSQAKEQEKAAPPEPSHRVRSGRIQGHTRRNINPARMREYLRTPLNFNNAELARRALDMPDYNDWTAPRQRSLYPPTLDVHHPQGNARNDRPASRRTAEDHAGVPPISTLLDTADRRAPPPVPESRNYFEAERTSGSSTTEPRRPRLERGAVGDRLRLIEETSRVVSTLARHNSSTEASANATTTGDVSSTEPLVQATLHSSRHARNPMTHVRSGHNSDILAASTRLDGLGDRNRSPTPPEEWEVMRSTIQPDATLPSAESSFTSAAANICADDDSIEATESLARDMYYREMESPEGRRRIADQEAFRAQEGNRFAMPDEAPNVDIGFRLIEAALERVEERHRSLRLRGQPRTTADYGADLTRLSDIITDDRARQMATRRSHGSQEPETSNEAPEAHPVSPPNPRTQMEQELAATEASLLADIEQGDQDLDAVRRIVEQLASRQDVPDEWWTSMGLNFSRTQPSQDRDNLSCIHFYPLHVELVHTAAIVVMRRSSDSSESSSRNTSSDDTAIEEGDGRLLASTHHDSDIAYSQEKQSQYTNGLPYINDHPSTLGSKHPIPRRRWNLRTILGLETQTAELRSTAWLDGLRGLAAFQVFIFHYCDGWFEHSRGWGQDGVKDQQWWRLPFIRSIYGSGDTAVCVFFAISGYVLTHKMLSLLRQNRRQDVYSFVASAMFRRGVRLYMPVIIESFILMVLGRVGFPKASGYDNAPTIFLELKRWAWSIIHLLMPLRYPDRWAEILNIYDGNISWTIPLEYYGSMVVYATLMIFTRARNYKVRSALIAAMVTTSFLRDDWVGAQFLLGMAFADYQLQQESRIEHISVREKRYRGLLFLVLFVFGIYLSGLPMVGLVSPYELWPRPFYHWISQPLAAMGAYVGDRKGDRYLTCLAGFSILMGVGETARLKRLMETRFVQYLGKISFGLYLCHIFLHAWLRPLDSIYFALCGLDPATARDVGGFRFFIAFCMMIVPATLVNFAVGSLFEKYLDRPSVRAAKAFEQWSLAQD